MVYRISVIRHSFSGPLRLDGAVAAAVLTGVALDAAAGWWWADPAAATVILVYAAREARHAWREAG